MGLQLYNLTQKLDFDVLWFRRRTYKIWEEKKKKKKKLIAAKSELVGIKGYLKTYTQYEIFFAVLNPICTGEEGANLPTLSIILI